MVTQDFKSQNELSSAGVKKYIHQTLTFPLNIKIVLIFMFFGCVGLLKLILFKFLLFLYEAAMRHQQQMQAQAIQAQRNMQQNAINHQANMQSGAYMHNNNVIQQKFHFSYFHIFFVDKHFEWFLFWLCRHTGPHITEGTMQEWWSRQPRGPLDTTALLFRKLLPPACTNHEFIQSLQVFYWYSYESCFSCTFCIFFVEFCVSGLSLTRVFAIHQHRCRFHPATINKDAIHHGSSKVDG